MSADVMVAANSDYKTVNTLFLSSTGTGELMLRAEPRRVYVQFITVTAAPFTQGFVPGPFIQLPSIPNTNPIPPIYKLKDHPSMVVGEWYYWGGAADRILITEVLYVGRGSDVYGRQEIGTENEDGGDSEDVG